MVHSTVGTVLGIRIMGYANQQYLFARQQNLPSARGYLFDIVPIAEVALALPIATKVKPAAFESCPALVELAL